MNETKLNCSLNDTAALRRLILENPDLPLLIFCGEEAYHGEYPYEQADASSGEIKELTLFSDQWLNKSDYEETLVETLLCDEEEYKDMPGEEFDKIINQRVAETEFVKAIVICVG